MLHVSIPGRVNCVNKSCTTRNTELCLICLHSINVQNQAVDPKRPSCYRLCSRTFVIGSLTRGPNFLFCTNGSVLCLKSSARMRSQAFSSQATLVCWGQLRSWAGLCVLQEAKYVHILHEHRPSLCFHLTGWWVLIPSSLLQLYIKSAHMNCRSELKLIAFPLCPL